MTANNTTTIMGIKIFSTLVCISSPRVLHNFIVPKSVEKNYRFSVVFSFYSNINSVYLLSNNDIEVTDRTDFAFREVRINGAVNGRRRTLLSSRPTVAYDSHLAGRTSRNGVTKDVDVLVGNGIFNVSRTNHRVTVDIKFSYLAFTYVGFKNTVYTGTL